jgi:DNA-binding transcriptional regulator YiaG
MTPTEFRRLRRALGLSCDRMAEALGMTAVHRGRTVRRWEAGTADIPGPQAMILAGYMSRPGLPAEALDNEES